MGETGGELQSGHHCASHPCWAGRLTRRPTGVCMEPGALLWSLIWVLIRPSGYLPAKLLRGVGSWLSSCVYLADRLQKAEVGSWGLEKGGSRNFPTSTLASCVSLENHDAVDWPCALVEAAAFSQEAKTHLCPAALPIINCNVWAPQLPTEGLKYNGPLIHSSFCKGLCYDNLNCHLFCSGYIAHGLARCFSLKAPKH